MASGGLIEFLISRGGVLDTMGDLRGMDLHRINKGVFGRLAHSKGLPLDHARECAEEAGYLRPGSDINSLLDAIRDQASGLPGLVPEERLTRGEALVARYAVESTDQGDQLVMPGTERSARQAAAGRDAKWHGRKGRTKFQADPDGLFSPPAVEDATLPLDADDPFDPRNLGLDMPTGIVTMPETLAALPQDFKAWRERLGYTQSDAADALGLGRRTIAYYESGQQEIPRTVQLACVALSLAHRG